MISICHDQIGRSLNLQLPARRIVSLVPSQTELLYHLGLTDEVVGITRFCIHPPHWFRDKKRVGGTKDFDLRRILSLQPDLILANKEENTQAGIEQLAEHFPVWVSNITTLPDAIAMIEQIGCLTNRQQNAKQLIDDIIDGFKNLPTITNICNLPTAYLIWRNPYMAAGNDTFINYMLTQICGLYNVFAHLPRYPTFSLDDLRQLQPRLVLLSSEPYPFKQQHIAEIKQVLPDAHICLADGEMFSWYGSRLREAARYLAAFLPQIVGH